VPRSRLEPKSRLTRSLDEMVRYDQLELVIVEDLELDEFEVLLRTLGSMAKGHQWWVGDALVYGEGRYGPDVFQAAGDSGLEEHTLVNWRWVASRVAPSRRRDDLSFTHHEAVARLDESQQEAMLETAATEKWSTRELREAVSIKFPQSRLAEPRADEPASDEPTSVVTLTAHEEASIARRLETLRTSWETWRDSGRRPNTLPEFIDGDDVHWLISTLANLTRGRR
jgi:hypothetical protein